MLFKYSLPAEWCCVVICFIYIFSCIALHKEAEQRWTECLKALILWQTINTLNCIYANGGLSVRHRAVDLAKVLSFTYFTNIQVRRPWYFTSYLKCIKLMQFLSIYMLRTPVKIRTANWKQRAGMSLDNGNHTVHFKWTLLRKRSIGIFFYLKIK